MGLHPNTSIALLYSTLHTVPWYNSPTARGPAVARSPARSRDLVKPPSSSFERDLVLSVVVTTSRYSSLLSHFRQLKAEEDMNNVVVTKVKRWTPPTRVVSTPRSRRRRKQTCGSVFHLTRQRSNVATSSSGPPSEPERPDLATELQYSPGLV